MSQKIQFLRNSAVVADKATAQSKLETILKSDEHKVLNGEPIVCMYYDGTDENKTVKALLGIVTKEGGYSIFAPSDETSGDIDAKISAAIQALKKDDTAVNNEYVSQVTETNGVISVSRVALPVNSVDSADKTVIVANTNGAVDVKVNIDGKTIVKDDTSGVLSVASTALTQYVGSNAIKVSDADASNNKTISLGINPNDKVLTQDANGLLASISMTYDSTAKKIYLYGNDTSAVGKAISSIDASDFVKDGVLSSVEYKTEGEGHAVADGPYLVFTWNTDAKATVTWVSLKGLVDVYTGTTDEIVVEDNVISLAQAIKDAIAAALTEISVSTTEVDAKKYITAKVSAKENKKQEVGVGVIYGSFKNGETAQVNGIATVEAVNDVIVENERVTSEALNKLNTAISTLDGAVLKKITAADSSVTVSETANNSASIKVNIDSESIKLDATKKYIYVDKVDGGEY